MKIIITDAVTSISADSNLTGYPASNAIDGHPKKQWKPSASSLSATLIAKASGNISGLAIFNIDADSVSLGVTDFNSVQWDDDATVGSAWVAPGPEWGLFDLITYSDLTINEASYKNYKAVWFEFEEIQASGLDFEITIVTAEVTDDFGIGEVYLGEVMEFPNPVLGLAEGQHDFSIIKELSNGATYVKPRDNVRTFNGRIQVARATEFYDFMVDFARNQGLKAAPWRITDIDDFNWVVFARFVRSPSSVHSQTIHSDITFDIIEVL